MGEPSHDETAQSLMGAFSAQGHRQDELAAFLDGMVSVPAVRAHKRRSYELLQLRGGSRVLDVGCGLGWDVAELARIVGVDHATGVDPSAEFVQAAREVHDGHYVTARAEALPFPDARFDACRADRVIHHLQQPQTAFREFARVLCPGGILAITELDMQLRGSPEKHLETDRLITRQMLGPEMDASWLGHFYPVMLERADLHLVDHERNSSVVTDPDDVARCLALEWAEANIPDDLLQDVLQWRQQLETDLRSGRRWLVVFASHFVASR